MCGSGDGIEMQRNQVYGVGLNQEQEDGYANDRMDVHQEEDDDYVNDGMDVHVHQEEDDCTVSTDNYYEVVD